MPMKRSVRIAAEAVDMVEDYVNQAAEPLEQAMVVAVEAGKIPDLPQQVNELIVGLITEIERIDDVRGAIKAIREYLPDAAAEIERRRLKNRSQLKLVV